MGFAQPHALYFLAALAPIALLYLLKQRRRRVQVATLLFWEDIVREEHRVTWLTRLRKVLSLLLQLVFAVLLVLALAQPTWSAGRLGARRVLLIVDTSASMTTREKSGTRFEQARRLARDVVRGLSIGDTCMLATVADRPEIVVPFTSTRRDLLTAVASLEPTHIAGDFGGAADLPANLAPDPRPTTAYVITDGAFEPIDSAWPVGVSLVYLPVGEATDNVGITAFSARPLPAAPRDFHIMFEISNESDVEVRAPYEIHTETGLLDAGEVTVGAWSRVNRSVREYSAGGGTVRLRLDHGDAFALDNTAEAVLPPVRPVDVLLVREEPNPFLEAALATDDGIELTTMAPNAYAVAPASATVTVFDRCVLSAGTTGHAVYIRDWPELPGINAPGWLERPSIVDWDREHPVNRHVDYANVTVDSARAIEAHEGYRALVETVAGPLVLEGETEGRRTLVIAFDPGMSDLPLRVAFPVLVANAVRYCAGETPGSGWETIPLGSVLSAEDVAAMPTRREPRDIPLRAVIVPRDTSADVGVTRTVEEPGEIAMPALTAVTLQGVYMAAPAKGDAYPLFAANLTSRRESRIAPSPSLPLRERHTGSPPSGGLRMGVEPWFALIAAAFTLACLEWALFHRRWVE